MPPTFEDIPPSRSRASSQAAAQAQAKFNEGLALHQKGRLAQAQDAYQQVLKVQPDHFDALHLLGVIAAQNRNPERAVELIARAIDINPKNAAAYYNHGVALQELKQHEAALRSYDRAIALKPDYAEAHNNHGVALRELKQHEAAVQSYDRAIALKPDYAEAHSNRGIALRDLKQREAAVQSHDKAIALKPGYAEAYSNRGNALQDLKQHEAAVQSYDKAIALNPDYAEAYYNLGNALQDLGRYEAALQSYDRAISLNHGHADVYYNRGDALQDLERYPEAIASYDKAMAINAAHPYVAGERAHCSERICDWRDRERIENRILAGVRSSQVLTSPFLFLAISDDPVDQLNCARSYVQDRCPAVVSPTRKAPHPRHHRIRVAYLSADFHDHAMAYLMAGLFERHDRERFEVSSISFGPDEQSEMRSRLRNGSERFIDVREKSDEETAGLIRELEIDILVDLMGFTRNCRPQVLARRPAGIQVNHLGYPGTMGADFIDYIIADEFVISRGKQPHYSEKVVYLPDCFQPNDSERKIGERTPTRAEAGLPESGLVFCCFNNSYKINPEIFDVWMRVLRRTENSVLWLLGESQTAIANLQREARSRGVEPGRLVFAQRVEKQDYLARYRLADLFLDTLPFNAGTTASDALWAGLPLVTCAGHAFAARMAGSLLHAVGLPELVTHDLEDYEALIIKLATNEKLLREIKEKLARNRLARPLFDTDRFRRHIESAYTTMWEIHQRGEEPRSFAVPPAE